MIALTDAEYDGLQARIAELEAQIHAAGLPCDCWDSRCTQYAILLRRASFLMQTASQGDADMRKFIAEVERLVGSPSSSDKLSTPPTACGEARREGSVMTGLTCCKKVTGREYYGAHWSPCGRPAKFIAVDSFGNGMEMPVCGIHANQIRRRSVRTLRPIKEASK